MSKRLLGPVALLDILTNGVPHREVYRGDKSNRWFVTYGGGETTYAAVRELVEMGEIRSVYSDCPDEGYHVGRTLDMARSIFTPKKSRRLVYLD